LQADDKRLQLYAFAQYATSRAMFSHPPSDREKMPSPPHFLNKQLIPAVSWPSVLVNASYTPGVSALYHICAQACASKYTSHINHAPQGRHHVQPPAASHVSRIQTDFRPDLRVPPD